VASSRRPTFISGVTTNAREHSGAKGSCNVSGYLIR